jgi:tetratricopeptide (TPR) repeat protein
MILAPAAVARNIKSVVLINQYRVWSKKASGSIWIASGHLDYLDEQYKGSFFISNFCQDLEGELYNAGFEDPVYFKKSVEYCKEFCSYFPNEKELIIHNMKRSIAESYLHLGKIDEAKREFDSLVRDYPNNSWSCIAYGDMYFFGNDIIKDLSKAKEFYGKALMVVKNKNDRMAIEERLEDIAVSEAGNNHEQKKAVSKV